VEAGLNEMEPIMKRHITSALATLSNIRELCFDLKIKRKRDVLYIANKSSIKSCLKGFKAELVELGRQLPPEETEGDTKGKV
jgi:hypothetical protein